MKKAVRAPCEEVTFGHLDRINLNPGERLFSLLSPPIFFLKKLQVKYQMIQI